MTGEVESNSRCPLCGGRLSPGVATIPFVFAETVVLIKGVPAEVCSSCHESYVAGKVTDNLEDLLNRLRSSRAEVSIISYSQSQPAPARMPV